MIWLLLVGVGIEITGIVWDTLYHERFGYDELYMIPPAHYMDLVGAPFLFIMSILLLRGKKAPAWPLYFIIAGTLIQTVGWVWDNVGYHLRGIEPSPLAPPHIALNIGLLFMVVFSITAIIANAIKQARAKSSSKLSA
ncbi:hypothetical protein ACFFK0_21810 [Paenibacillus chartarius]|uniref:DUF2243 domain-containing protein n=1 Tax=Paenibacillus chartarius TaxID=747481 RepID=A0ABV6DQX1_9BACL